MKTHMNGRSLNTLTSTARADLVRDRWLKSAKIGDLLVLIQLCLQYTADPPICFWEITDIATDLFEHFVTEPLNHRCRNWSNWSKKQVKTLGSKRCNCEFDHGTWKRL